MKTNACQQTLQIGVSNLFQWIAPTLYIPISVRTMASVEGMRLSALRLKYAHLDIFNVLIAPVYPALLFSINAKV